MRIVHFGTFDVDNYGDLLFPLVLERRLSDVCEEIIHISPTSGPPVWEDCVPTVGFDEFLEGGEDVDGVVIGGGQIVRTAPTFLETYDRGGVSAFTTYPNLWLGAAYVAARNNVPLCWNAPGVSSSFGPVASELIKWSASVTDYLAVRDETSRRSLEEAGVSRNINVVPDSAIEISSLWGEGEISSAYQEVFARRNRPVPPRTIVFHVNTRWMGEEAAAVAARIDRICKKLNSTPILVAIGPCHGDDEVQLQVSREMGTDPLVIDQPKSLLEITACIAHSYAYFGSSLHGMIAACSFGTRGALVASGKDHKYTGFLDHLGLSQWLVESWSEAEQRAGELSETPGTRWRAALDPVLPTLEEHWSRLGEALTSGGGSPQDHDKRAATEQLQHIGEDAYKTLPIFQPLLLESLEKSGTRMRELSRDLRRERQRFRQTRQNLMLLKRWMQTVDEALQDLWASRQWRTASAVAKLQRKILRQPKRWGAREQLDSQLQRFRDWDEKFEDSEEDSSDEV